MLTDSQYSTRLLKKCPRLQHLLLSGHLYRLVKHLTLINQWLLQDFHTLHERTLLFVNSVSFRSSRLEVLCKKDVIRNFETATLLK